MSRPSSARSFCYILLASIMLSACSGLSKSEVYQSQAEELATEGHLPEAVLTYRQALKSDPQNSELLSGLGLVLAAQGRDRSALQILNQAAVRSPNDVSIKNALAKLIVRPQDGLSLQLAWLVNAVDSKPVGSAVASGNIFVVYDGGHLIALDQESGQEMWKIESSVAFTSPPAANADQVWVGAEDGSIFVYSAASGGTVGVFHTNGAVYAAPALTATTAYCSSNDGTLYALNRTSFNLIWKSVIGDALHVTPLVSGQSVYVGSNDGRLYALNASIGERIWKYGILTQGAVESIPTFANEKIFVGSGDGRIYALDAATGGEYWRFSTPDAIYAQPLVLNDQLIIASSGQVLASIRTIDGVANWSLRFDHPITEAPIFFKDRLYVATRGDPRLFAVNYQTGKLLGELNTGDWIASGPLITGTDLILVGEDGAVFLYR